MPNCGCGAQTCSCRIIAGENITITGSGSARDPWQISAAGGGEGSTGFRAGDRKETYRTDTEAGWLEENGQAVSRTTYADLFAAIGTRFGSGDGTNTFNVPNAAGRTTVGVGPGYPQDQTAGSATTTLTAAMLPRTPTRWRTPTALRTTTDRSGPTWTRAPTRTPETCRSVLPASARTRPDPPATPLPAGRPQAL